MSQTAAYGEPSNLSVQTAPCLLETQAPINAEWAPAELLEFETFDTLGNTDTAIGWFFLDPEAGDWYGNVPEDALWDWFGPKEEEQ